MGKVEQWNASSAEIARNFGLWQSRALTGPVVITHHGKPRVVLVSAEAFESEASTTARELNAIAAYSEPHRLLNGLMNNMLEGLISFNGDLEVLRINRYAETFLGKSQDDLKGKKLADVFGIGRNSLIRERLERSISTGQTFDFEVQSTIFPERRVHVRTFPYEGGGALIFLNITDFERLAASSEERDSIAAALTVHRGPQVAWVDLRGRVTHLPDGESTFLDIGVAEIVGVRIWDLVAHRDRQRLQRLFEDVLEYKAPKIETMTVLVRGVEEREVTIVVSPLLHDLAVRGALVAIC